MDFKGNVEYQWAFYGGLTTGTPGGSLEIYHTVTSAPDVTKLRGMGYNIGASFAAGGALSVDGVIIPDTDLGKIYWGASVAGGIGGGLSGMLGLKGLGLSGLESFGVGTLSSQTEYYKA
jgi:hypothetical protein